MSVEIVDLNNFSRPDFKKIAKILAYEQQIRTGCRAILVESKETAITFYDKHKFTSFDISTIPTPMFLEIEALGGRHKIKSSPGKMDMLTSFIEFTECFNLLPIGETFKKLLTTVLSGEAGLRYGAFSKPSMVEYRYRLASIFPEFR